MKTLRTVLMAANAALFGCMVLAYFETGGVLPARTEPKPALDTLIFLIVLFAANAVALLNWRED